jgi:hypothetical protein
MSRKEHETLVSKARRRLAREFGGAFPFVNICPVGGCADNAKSWSAQVSYIVDLAGANATISSTAEHDDPQAATDAAFDGIHAALTRRRLMRVEELRAEAEALDQKAAAIRATADDLERFCR